MLSKTNTVPAWWKHPGYIRAIQTFVKTSRWYPEQEVKLQNNCCELFLINTQWWKTWPVLTHNSGNITVETWPGIISLTWHRNWNGNWTLRLLVISPTRHFAYWTVHNNASIKISLYFLLKLSHVGATTHMRHDVVICIYVCIQTYPHTAKTVILWIYTYILTIHRIFNL